MLWAAAPAGALQVVGVGSGTPMVQAVCGGMSTGPETVVVSDATRDRLGLNGWPDAAFGILPQGGGRYRFLGVAALAGSGGRQQSIAVTDGTLDDPVAGGVVRMAAPVGIPAGFSYAGGGPVYRDPGSGLVLQTLHMERRLSGGGYYSELHLGRFDPASGVTTHLGTIVTPQLDPATADAQGWSADMGTPSLTVVGGYLRVYFTDYGVDGAGNRTATALSAAQASLADVLNAAGRGTVVPWFKYHDGGWDSPAIGGASADLRPGQPPAWHPSTARTADGGTLIAYMTATSEIQLTTSPDGIGGWTAPQPLFRDPDHFDAYPTIVGLGADPSVVDGQFSVYYLQWANPSPNWDDARVMRRLVTCTAGQPAGTRPLVRYAGGGHHRVTTAVVSTPGSYPEQGGVWYLSSTQQAGTRALYGCRAGTDDWFVSTDPGCDGTGNAIVQTEGWIWTSPPSAPATPLYRCFLPSVGDHFVSIDAGCESPAAVDQGTLGYALTTTKIVFSRFRGDHDEHWDTSGPVSARYQLEHRYLLEGSPVAGTVPLYGCSYPTPSGVDHFASLRADCEGTSVLRTEGWLYVAPQPGASTALHRCYWPAAQDHFLSASTDCEGVSGGVDEGLLGYVTG